jgi:hypothetical protein
MRKIVVLWCLVLPAAGCTGTRFTWQHALRQQLPLMGRRNWIVVADMAYPFQSRPGVTTVFTGTKHLESVSGVLSEVRRAPHLRAVVYTAAELAAVAETDAPGITAHRKELDALLKGETVKRLPREKILARLDEEAKTFRVLVIKTRAMLPYSAVFVQLDCGYWGPGAEQRLRKALEAK